MAAPKAMAKPVIVVPYPEPAQANAASKGAPGRGAALRGTSSEPSKQGEMYPYSHAEKSAYGLFRAAALDSNRGCARGRLPASVTD
jgi:hypothetical protein